jgi:hypothetical protein
MDLDEAKEHWNAPPDTPSPSMSNAQILSLVKDRSEDFDRTIRHRDWRESIAAGAVFLIFATMLFDPSWLVRAGALVVMGSSVFVYWTLRRARSDDEPPAGAPVAEVLRAERAKVDRQIRLLQSVLWWYVGPLAVGALLIVAGNHDGLYGTLASVAIILGGAAGIVYLNQRAVRRDLRPRREELTALLERVDGRDGGRQAEGGAVPSDDAAAGGARSDG